MKRPRKQYQNAKSVRERLAILPIAISKLSAVQNVLEPDERTDWMSLSVGWGKCFEDSYFFSAQSKTGKWSLGRAEIIEGRISNPRPVLFSEETSVPEHCWTPVVAKSPRGYIMSFAGRGSYFAANSIFLAESVSLDGLWEIKKEILSPREPWEGRVVDLGPGVYREEGCIYLFYSTASTRWRVIAKKWFNHPCFPTIRRLQQFEIRKIGILKINLSSLESSHSKTPLPLNGEKGSTNESVFCPGYGFIKNVHFLLLPTSIYSIGFPFRQAVSLAQSPLAPIKWQEEPMMTEILSSRDLPPDYSMDAAFDTPDLIFRRNNAAKLYFSTMSRRSGKWRVMSCDISIEET
ncbi:MAG: hypothetical protein ACYCQJ_02800 [Nitrososphaerales archaeon]